MIYIDTSAFLARYLKKDNFHKRGVAAWKRLPQEHCFTSNFVLDETFTLLARWAGYEFAAAKARRILSSTALDILRPTIEDEIEAVDVFEKYADQKVSFTDCISFVLMRRNKIARAFAFDAHFARAGFELWPE